MSMTDNYSFITKPGFIRIKLIELDPAPSYNNNPAPSYNNNPPANLNCSVINSIQLDPICAVNIKELVRIETGSSNSSQSTSTSKNNHFTLNKNPPVIATFNSSMEQAVIKLPSELDNLKVKSNYL